MAKHLVCLYQNGGMDGINFFGPSDQSSIGFLSSARQGATDNLPNYIERVVKTGILTKGSATITGMDTTGLEVGDVAYNSNLSSIRKLKILSLDSTTVTLDGVSTVTKSLGDIYFNTSVSTRFPVEDSDYILGKPLLHYSQVFLNDTVNRASNLENASKTKSAIISNIGPLVKPLHIEVGTSGRRGLYVNATGAGAMSGPDTPSYLTSHNDQASTFHTNSSEGATKGWGGGIADSLLNTVSSKNKPLLTVSAAGLQVFCAGENAKTFTISSSGLISSIPDLSGNYTRESNDEIRGTLTDLYINTIALSDGHKITDSIIPSNILARDFQEILKDTIDITNIPSNSIVEGFNAANVLNRFKQIARLILANNPNRGATGVRVGNELTISTEISTGIANRVSGSKVVRVYAVNHGLFTSSDSGETDNIVVVNSVAAGLDSSNPSNGYSIAVDPLEPDNYFTLSTTKTTALTDVSINFRIKHNTTINDVVYLEGLVGIDTPINTEGYQVTEVVDNTTFKIMTTSSSAIGADDIFYFKPVDLESQVIYSDMAMSWDSHNGANNWQLAVLDLALTYFDSLVSRMARADVVTFGTSEFGRTVSTNAKGTDHGWGSNLWVFGKSVKSGIYGDLPDYDPNGVHVINNILMPTTSVYQYGATFARWLGLSDLEVIELFPKIVNWSPSERYLDFL